MQSTPRRTLCALPATVAIVLFLGCGGGSPEMNAKTPDSETPTTVPDALAELDRAEAELGYAIGSPTFAAPPPPTVSTGAADAPRESVGTTPSPAAAPAGGGQSTQAAPAAASPCSNACRALASMTRSADHVCGLAGEGDNRCENARLRVERATDRVRAQCPGCQ